MQSPATNKPVLTTLAFVLCVLTSVVLYSGLEPGRIERPREVALSAPMAGLESEAVAKPPAAAPRREPAVSRSAAPYSAAVGTRLRYSFSSRVGLGKLRAEEVATGSIPSEGSEILAGGLEQTLADRRGEEMLVRVRFRDLSLLREAIGATSQDEGHARALGEEPLWMRIGADGTCLGFRFPDGLSARDRNRVRTVLGGLAFVVRPEETGTWSALQGDACGVFEATYQGSASDHCAGVELRREKSGYTDVGYDREALAEDSLRTNAHAHHCNELGWLRDAHVSEQLVLEVLGMDMRLAFSWNAELVFESVDRVAGFEPDVLDELWSGPWEPAAGHRDADPQEAQADREETWARRLAGKSAGELLAGLRSLFDRDEETARIPAHVMVAWLDALAWKVRLDPEAANDVERAILACAECVDQASFLMQVLARAETDAAQLVLSRLLVDRSAGPGLSDLATEALFLLEHPNRDLLSAVAADVETLGYIEEWDEPAERRLLLLGALSTRWSGSLYDDRTAVEVLLGMEESARATGNAATWLHALGNAGGTSVESHALRYIQDGSEEVREAAALALRKCDTETSRAALIEQAAGDDSASVREAAFQALVTAGSDDWRRELTDVALGSGPPDQRRVALFALSFREGRRSQTTLEQVAGGDHDDGIRDLARELLARVEPSPSGPADSNRSR